MYKWFSLCFLSFLPSFSGVISFSCQGISFQQPTTKPTGLFALPNNLSAQAGENNFYLKALPYRYKNHQFFLANFVMDGNLFNYFNDCSKEGLEIFIERFIDGLIYLNQIDIKWNPVISEMHLLFDYEARKSTPHPNFIQLLKRYITNNWTNFKGIFTCTTNNTYSNWRNDLPYAQKYEELRRQGGTLQMPFLYGLLPETFPKEEEVGWRIGDAVRMTVNNLQTKPMLKYFYDELQTLDKQKRVFYAVKGPTVKVHITGDLRVLYHLPTLLAALQTKFRFTDQEIRSIQIAPESYMMAVRDHPGSSFYFDFLNPLNHHEVCKTKSVRFYNK